MELSNEAVELVAVDRGYLEALVLGRHHAQEMLAQAERTVAGLKKDLERVGAERDELAGSSARDMPVTCAIRVGDFPCGKRAVAATAYYGQLTDVCRGHLTDILHLNEITTRSTVLGGPTTPVQTTVTTSIEAGEEPPFMHVLVRLSPIAATKALGYLAGMTGGPLPDDHALRPVYDQIKKAMTGSRAGSES